MGLGAPKRRNKLSHDPNNTAWSRSASNFGHRILSQQGWQPGQYLGAENANHSDHYTAANASHIRILLRENNLGLGAKVGGNKAETFGLSLFSGVLGRLNGKSDGEVQKQQDALRDAELRQYQVGKYGFMNFVSGGLLVGDKIEKPGDKKSGHSGDRDEASNEMTKKGKKRKAWNDDGEGGVAGKQSKKQRTEEAEGRESQNAQDSIPEESAKAKPSREDKKRRQDGPSNETSQSDSTTADALTAKKSKKKREKADVNEDSAPAIPSTEKARLKEEKRARKEDRRKRKEAKRLKKETKANAASTTQIAQAAKSPAQSINGGRHAVRHRYIQQKRMAGMDAQAMREIFMMKAAG